MWESLVGGILELYAMEVQIVESSENAIEDCCHYWWRLGSDDSPTIGERRCM